MPSTLAYRRHGVEQVSPERTTELLRADWTIPDRQIETSVVPVRSGTSRAALLLVPLEQQCPWARAGPVTTQLHGNGSDSHRTRSGSRRAGG
jgi:hypothetical protein